MRKTKVKAVVFDSWEAVDAALLRIRQLEPDLTKMSATCAAAIAKAKEAYTEDAPALAEEIDSIREGLHAFMTEHAAELDEKRSRKLDNGTVSLRRTPPALALLSGSTWKRALAVALTLPKKVREAIVERKDSLKKGALRDMIRSGDLKDEHRKALGVKVDQEDEVWYELT